MSKARSGSCAWLKARGHRRQRALAQGLPGQGHRGVAGGAGLVLGQRPVGRPEPQGQGQGFATLPDLRAGIDVEQSRILQQVAGTLAYDVDHGLSRHVVGDDEADVLEDRRVRRHRGP